MANDDENGPDGKPLRKPSIQDSEETGLAKLFDKSTFGKDGAEGLSTNRMSMLKDIQAAQKTITQTTKFVAARKRGECEDCFALQDWFTLATAAYWINRTWNELDPTTRHVGPVMDAGIEAGFLGIIQANPDDATSTVTADVKSAAAANTRPIIPVHQITLHGMMDQKVRDWARWNRPLLCEAAQIKMSVTDWPFKLYPIALKLQRSLDAFLALDSRALETRLTDKGPGGASKLMKELADGDGGKYCAAEFATSIPVTVKDGFCPAPSISPAASPAPPAKTAANAALGEPKKPALILPATATDPQAPVTPAAAANPQVPAIPAEQ